MDRQMQRSMPAHLRKYTEGNSYIPKHAERAIAQHMEKTMPGQFKKYAGSYVQQKVMSQHMAIAGAAPQSMPAMPSPAGHGPSPNLSPHGQFHPSAAPPAPQPVPPAAPGSTVYPVAPPQPQPLPPPGQPAAPDPAQAPMYPGGQPQPVVSQSQPYDFITNPEQPSSRRALPSLPGISPTAMRAALIAGGLVALLILFIVIKGLLSGGGNLPSFVSVAQDQQELIHLATNASQQHGTTTGNQNFAATASLSLTSSQAAIVQYLAANGQKVNAKVLGLKISAATDSQLTAAAAATTYDQTFQQIMKTDLTAYLSRLQQTYKQTTGGKGRALLSDDYKQAQLLLTQLNAPS
jgi:hypothetical protein